MYVYLDALVLPAGNNPVWTKKNIVQETIKTISETYLDGWIQIRRGTQPTRTISLADLKSSDRLNNVNITLEMFLLGYPPSLQISTRGPLLPTVTRASIRYSDGYRAMWKPKRIGEGHPAVVVPEEQSTDLLLSNQTKNLTEYDKYVLTTVNGLLHMTYPEVGYGIRVVEGSKSLDVCGKSNYGFLSFKNLGELTRIPIILGMIDNPDVSIPFRAAVYLNLGENLTGKSLMMSIGGYLHLNDGLVDIINAELGLIRVNTAKLPIVDRLFDSQEIINLEYLDIERRPDDKKMINLVEINSNPFWEKYLTMSQTFAIVVDTPTIYAERQLVEQSGLVGMYYSENEPIYPIVMDLGRLEEYTANRGFGKWWMTVIGGLYVNRQYTTTNWGSWTWIGAQSTPNNPLAFAIAHYLQIGTETLST